MRYNFSNKKVEFLLDELGEEYKSLLTEKTLDRMRIFDVDNIDLSELIKLDIEVKKYLKVKEKDRTRKRLWSIMALLGVLYFMTGFLILTLDYVRPDMSNSLTKEISIILSFSGALIFILSVYFSVFSINKLKRSKNKDTSYYVLINKWKEIEALIIQLTPAEYQRGNNNMVEYLRKNKMISNDEENEIFELLQTRNNIVHVPEDNIQISKEELQEQINVANKLITKLSKAI